MKKFIVLILMLIPILLFAEPAQRSAKTEGTARWTITWDDGAANTANITPDTDTKMNIYRASSVAISCSTLASDDIGATTEAGEPADVDVLASVDCSNFDTDDDSDGNNYYVEDFISDIDDNEQTTETLTTASITCIKLRMDNEHATLKRDMTCRVTATWD